jgi:hypothetical protein
MGLASMFYQTIAKRTSTLALTLVGGALVFERGFDSLCKFPFFLAGLMKVFWFYRSKQFRVGTEKNLTVSFHLRYHLSKCDRSEK